MVRNVAHVVESDKSHKVLSSNHVLLNFSVARYFIKPLIFYFQNKMEGKEEVFEQTFTVQARSLVDFKAVVKVLNYKIPVSKCLVYFTLWIC